MNVLLTFLSKHFAWVFVAGLVTGLVFQELASLINPYIFYSLMLALFFNYVKVDVRALALELRRPVRTLLFAGYVLVVLPVLAFGLVRLLSGPLQLDDSWALGALLLFAGPTGVIAPTAALMLGGKFEKAVANVVLTSLLAPLTMPALLWLLPSSSGEADVQAMFLKLATLIVIPFAAATTCKRLWAGASQKISPYAGPLAVACLFLVIVGAMHGLAPRLAQKPSLVIIALALLTVLFAGAFVLPWLLLRGAADDDRLTVSIASTWMNNGIVIVLASQVFHDPVVLLFVTLSEVPWGLAFLPASWWVRRLRLRGRLV